MINELRYEAPKTLEAAIALLGSAEGLSRILAGGSDLLVQMRSGRVEPALIVDVKGIPEMTTISAEKGGFRLGTGLGQKAVEVFDVLGNANATSAATCCGFDHHRKADFQRQGTGLIGVFNPPI